MVGAEVFFKNVQRLLVVLLGCCQVALRAEHAAEVVEASGGVGVVFAQHRAPDFQCLLEVAFGSRQVGSQGEVVAK